MGIYMKSDQLLNVTIKQLINNFVLSDTETIKITSSHIGDIAYEKSIYALSHMSGKYYHGDLNPFNSVMYCNYLYWLSHEAFIRGLVDIAAKVYYLNKMLNSVELFYEIELPSIWTCEHPIGSVMGRAKYGDYFLFYQGCTVGGNKSKNAVGGGYFIL